MMKKIISIILLSAVFLMPAFSKNYLPFGSEARIPDITQDKRTEIYYADLKAELYSYHSFGFTNAVFTRPNSEFAKLAEIILQKVDDHTYATETNSLYFSYNTRGLGEYNVVLYGNDLKLQSSTKSLPYFSTDTKVTFPDGYLQKEAHSVRGTDGQYSGITLMNGRHPALGSYGSVEVGITAKYTDDKTNKPITDPKIKPLADGYFGDFVIICMPKETV